MDAALNSAVLGLPPKVNVTLVSSALVSAEPAIVMFGAVPPEDAKGEEAVTLVTVPLPVPAPMAVLNVVASNVETELSALMRTKVIALGFASVKKLEPTVVAPKFVRAPAAVEAPDPPRATDSCPDHPSVNDAALSKAVLALPPSVSVTLVSSVFVNAAGLVHAGAPAPALCSQSPELPAVFRAKAEAVE